MSASATDDLTLDVRLIQRNLTKGFVGRTAIDKLLSGLPDVADKGEFIDIDPIVAENDDLPSEADDDDDDGDDDDDTDDVDDEG